MRIALLLLFTILPALTLADAAVVVHPSNQLEINDRYLRSLFMGKRPSFPDGSSASVFLPESDHHSRQLLLKLVLNKSERQLTTFWTQLKFTGRGKLPVVSSIGDENIKAVIQANQNAIGVIDASLVDDSVTVVRWLRE